MTVIDVKDLVLQEKTHVSNGSQGEPFSDQLGDLAELLTIQGLFQEQVYKTPDAIAVVFGEQRLTYAELNQQANRLAHHLRQQYDVKRGEFVALLMNRSSDMIVCLLAILKAGAAYIPIDPRHPSAIIRDILQETKAKVLLLDSAYYFMVSDIPIELFLVDDELEGLTTPTTNPAVVSNSHDLAYIIYTSGSTGYRKGVAIEQRSIVNTLQWRVKYYAFDKTDATLQLPSYAFDSSVVDIFAMLLAGGSIVIPCEELRTDPFYLKRLIVEHGVSHFVITPTFYNLLIDYIADSASTLRSITVAGEPITKKLVQKHYHHFPHVQLVNEYGPTENAVCSTAHRLRGQDEWISIGKPIPNVQVYILDHNQNPVSSGEKGEIYLAGIGLARGYFNQPTQTLERFLFDPFVDQPGQRMYRTGDIGCMREDGLIEFFGRTDDQVKIRGFRIELGEVEHAILSHPAIQEVVVLCTEATDQEKHLCAYVVGGAASDMDRLRDHVRQRLPRYMVPDFFMQLQHLPMTINGKVDRRALLALQVKSDQTIETLQPRNTAEAKLLQIWSEELKHQNFNVFDDFFTVGGNSLRAVKVITRIHEEFHVDLAVPELYLYTTV